ncbi:MAG TPA: class I adenylate-forming enzyme family protein [Thiobacillaceae bacterium]|nr:class I adenylate-forming enzyme family protein [Thiobacillaceae bacterium]
MPFPPFPDWTWDIPEYFNIGVACTDAHLETPHADQIAMIVEDDALGTATATYRDLAQATSRFAQLLRDLGVKLEDRVLIRLPNSLAYPTAFFGAMKRGAIAVPTSTLLTAEEVVYLAKDSGATVLVTDKAMWAGLKNRLAGLEGLKHVLLAGPGDLPPSPASGGGAGGEGTVTVLDLDQSLDRIATWSQPHKSRADDAAYLVYTSGTTGYPKGVLHAHRAMIGREPAAHYWFDFHPEGDRILHSGKFNWTYVLGSGLMDPLYRGKTVIVHEGKNDAAGWIRLMARHAATIFIGVPTIYRQILQKTAATGADVPALRHCMSAGEHLSDEMLGLWKDRFGMEIYEAVGMSECSYYLSENKFRPIRPGSAGFPQPGHGVKLLDPDTLAEVPTGEEGMICIPADDPGLFMRYWNLPEETAKAFRGGWFLTGDYARLDADGYLWFLGRKDDIINSFGYRVSPHEIERVLKTHPAVADCAATGEELDKDKVLVTAYVVPHPGSQVTADELAAFGRAHLAAYKAPKIVYLVDDYPRTKNGKVIRTRLEPGLARTRSGN